MFLGLYTHFVLVRTNSTLIPKNFRQIKFKTILFHFVDVVDEIKVNS